jgi:deoxycytidylate deaminase
MLLFSKVIKLVGGKKLVIASNYIVKDGALPSIHAEHNALTKLIRLNRYRRMIDRSDKVDLVVIRFSKSGKLGDSRPCKDCLIRLMNSQININNVYYTDSSGIMVSEKFPTMFDSELTSYSSGRKLATSHKNKKIKKS